MNIPQCTQEIFKYFWMKREETVDMWKKSHMSEKKRLLTITMLNFFKKKELVSQDQHNNFVNVT